ncbi:hypothetical protein GH714_039417 [Hevea brasiliensis]|uniref:Uncharacterized protein n=1 Tax=Hevea brasiliensis TaxID=3981 RepID=A0A6A6KNB7_HEVBR|nr:hypothetical protein GH714_039417 [Hevea brasiliensis]
MRASPLYAFADLDVGLPKKVETKEKTIEAIIELPPPSQPTETNLLANLVAIQGLFPPNITVPGWKPGMMVEQQLQPVAPQGLHKPSETIQVRHVQIDILDQDDDSSNYSSDDGNSNDEDWEDDGMD